MSYCEINEKNVILNDGVSMKMNLYNFIFFLNQIDKFIL